MAKNNQAAATAKLAAAAGGTPVDGAVQSTVATSTGAPAEASQGAAPGVGGNAVPAPTAAEMMALVGDQELAAAVLHSAEAPTQGGAPSGERASTIAARVLVDGRFGRVNTVVQVTADELSAAGGELDSHPAAVAYAKSLASRG